MKGGYENSRRVRLADRELREPALDFAVYSRLTRRLKGEILRFFILQFHPEPVAFRQGSFMNNGDDQQAEATQLVPDPPPIEAETVTETFHVPRRLSMASLLCGMLAFSGMFAILRFSEVPGFLYFWLIAFVAAIAVSQMVFERSPRLASTITGGGFHFAAILLALANFVFDGSGSFRIPLELLCLLIIFVPIGAALGYVTGGALAGFWLVADYLDRRYALVTRRTDA